MTTRLDTSYLPSTHGFHFCNHFLLDVVGIHFWGRCNGMSETSLDYFHAGLPAPASVVADFGNPPLSGPTVASVGSVVQLFCLTTGPGGDRPGALTLAGTGFSIWNFPVSGVIKHAPAVATWPSGRTHLLAVGMDNSFYHCDYPGNLSGVEQDCSGYMPGFAAIGGSTQTSPALTAPFEGRLEAYCLGDGDGAAWFRYFDADSWKPWAPLGKPPGIDFNSNPTAIGWFGFMAVYMRGTDHGFWECRWQDGGWQPWSRVGGGEFTSGPAACKLWDGRYHLFGRGNDGVIWINAWEGGWTNWTPLARCPAELTTDAPAAVAVDGTIQVYARATDGTFWRLRWEGEWLPWEQIVRDPDPISVRLNEGIFNRNMNYTIYPLLTALGLGGPLGLLALPSLGNFVAWQPVLDDPLFQMCTSEELPKIMEAIRGGKPVPLGLLEGGGFGHEVVAFGLESDTDLPADLSDADMITLGAPWRIKIYDPNHPNCDNVFIRVDANATDGRIRSSTHESWRAFFVRGDYTPMPPPV